MSKAKYEIIYVNKKGKLDRDTFDNMAMFGWAINGFNASDLEIISYGEIND